MRGTATAVRRDLRQCDDAARTAPARHHVLEQVRVRRPRRLHSGSSAVASARSVVTAATRPAAWPPAPMYVLHAACSAGTRAAPVLPM